MNLAFWGITLSLGRLGNFTWGPNSKNLSLVWKMGALNKWPVSVWCFVFDLGGVAWCTSKVYF